MGLRLRLRSPSREARMGRIRTSVTVGSFSAPECQIRCDALVDTGAYWLTLPAAWKERLGPLPLSRNVELHLADHRVVRGEICGPLRVQIDGFDPIGGEVIFLDMPDEAEPLIGYLTLEQVGIVVDLVGHRLVKLPYRDMKQARARVA